MIPSPIVSRRRLLSVTAAFVGTALLPFGAAARPQPFVWRGNALGAAATVTLYHPDRTTAQRLVEKAVSEIERLERIFSLYRTDSSISRLNRAGRLDSPPLDLVALLDQARAVSELTGGAFDPSVQPLWRLYADHFAQPEADPKGPDAAMLRDALALVDYRAIGVRSDRIAFERPGMGITLNGIAQGYITDRVAEILRKGGLDRVLIDLGEIRGLGRHPDGRPWTAGIADPADRESLLHEVVLDGRALATSAGAATRFEPSGRHHHLFDPRNGRSAQQHASLSVLAPSASLADGLSTGFSSMGPDAIAEVCRGLSDVTALTLDLDGQLRNLGA